MKPLIVFGCVVKWKAVAIRKEDIRFLSLENRIVRVADIEVRCSEGPVWIILLFKQLFIGVHFYQLCQAEELL